MTSSLSPGRPRQRNWLEFIVEGVPGALLVAGRDRLIAMVNHNTEVLFGYSRAQLLGQPIEMLLPERLRDRHVHQVMRFFADPKARPMGANRELLGRRRDGSEVSIEIGLNPIETSGGMFTVALIIDATGRSHTEELRQQMAALVESADDAILSKTLDGVIRSWNPGAERLLGYRAEEIIGQSVTKLLPDDRQGEAAMILERIGNGQRVEHFETVRRRSDGSLVHVSLTISPIRDRAGSIVGASKIMRDITEHKRIEDDLRRSNAELGRKNAELDDFVYTASHDLRAPLTGVSTVAQWILDDDHSLTDETRNRLLLIHRRIDRMKRLLNDIRDYARTGRFAEAPGTAQSAAMLVADIAATSHVPAGFSIECDPSLQAVQVYRVPVEQVLRNLINNAIKHHDRRHGAVTVSVESRDDWHRFSVIDDGPGVPEQYRDSIFEMFQTLKPRDEVEGSGIGLALVRKIVGRMGGTCGCEPTGERGANFWFEWPRSGLPARESG
jgi:PAS domain S-box-containing protein